jgi:lysozyme
MNVGLAVELAVALCKRWEGCYLSPYLCPAGVPTIGYGTTYYPDGSKVALTDNPITKKLAEVLLIGTLQRDHLNQVINLCPGIDTPERLAAIIDFAYNCGNTALKNSNLRRKINAGQWDDVPVELKKWVRGGGKVLKGLTLRREAEASLTQQS